MIYKMFSVLDKKIGAYNTPMFFRSRGEAVRAFSDACGNKDDNFAKHPEDYCWCYMGEFHDDTGECLPVRPPEIVLTALDVVVKADI